MHIKPLFSDLAAPEVALGWGLIDSLQGEPNTDEWLDIQHAAPTRQQEFIAGRHLVRQLSRSLGLPDAPVRRAEDRSPCWPVDRRGSLSHCATLCAAAVSKADTTQSIGIDVERIGRVETKLWPTLFTARECTYLEQLEVAAARLEATLFFSAKESFYKCQYPLTRNWVGFQDVELQRTSDTTLSVTPTRSAPRPWHGSPIHTVRLESAHVATLMALPA